MNDKINKIIEQLASKRAELIESFILAYLQKTGLGIEEIELVERNEGTKMVWYPRKKGSE